MLIADKTHQYIFSNYARFPITLTRGEGAYVWDTDNNQYLDFLSGIACTPLGHCHPQITQAIMAQANTLLHTSNLFYTSPGAELAECLVKNGGLDKVFFCNSGTEANEAAIKLARKYQWDAGHPEKHVILSATHSFHGRTLGALAATAKPSIQQGFGPMPEGFKYADWQDADAFCRAIDASVAAVILEPIQGESGVHVMSKNFLQRVRSLCDQTNTLLIFDEVQCGIGRTGHLFAYQYYGVKPDIITLAKGLANGLPIGAVCAHEKAAGAFKPGDHGSTFGGNPVSCKAAVTVLTILQQENLLTQVKQRSEYLLAELQRLHKKYPQLIKEVRGVGLMIGIELTVAVKPLLSYCQDHGLLLGASGENVIRLLPPYVITEEHIARAVAVLDAGLA